MNQFPEDICDIISRYAEHVVLKKWVPLNKLYLNKIFERSLINKTNVIDEFIIEYKNNPKSNDIDWRFICNNNKNNNRILDILIYEYEKNPFSKIAAIFSQKYIDLFDDKIRSTYNDDPLSENINWCHIHLNTKTHDIVRAEYKRDPNSKRLDWSLICSCPEFIDIVEAEYKRDPDTRNLQWHVLSCNLGVYDFIDYSEDIMELQWM